MYSTFKYDDNNDDNDYNGDVDNDDDDRYSHNV
jgi:hypothetical protein